MKKKYSTLLNFALAGCLATTLAACGNDGDKSTTGGVVGTASGPEVSIGGNVMDTNGQPLAGVTVSCQGVQAQTNSSGQYAIHELRVINTAGGREGTTNSYEEFDQPVQCIVEAPAGYLGAHVWVYPEAQILNNLYDNTSEELTNTNQPILWTDGLFAQAATAWLPKLDSEVCGVLRMCATEEPVRGADLRLDMWAVNNNTSMEQAQEYGYTYDVSYATGLYLTTTDEVTGAFCISDVPDDSILRLYAPMYQSLEVYGNGAASVDPNYGNCSGTTPCTAEGDYITTVNEGLLNLGNVCVNPIPDGDSTPPCVADIEGWIYPLGFQPGGTVTVDTPWFDDTLEFALLNDNIDGTDGIDIIFNESLQSGAINANSVVIWDVDAKAYITDFTTALDGNTLTITTTDPIPADDHILVYLLRDDFQDLAGNYLYAEDIFNSPASCSDVFFAEEFYSNNDTAYVVVGFKIHSPDSTNVGEVTDLDQVCLDHGGDAGLVALNAAYPSVFTDQGTSTTTGLFQNLNYDNDYEFRLEALADVLGGTDSGLADIDYGVATVTFTEAGSGSWEATMKNPSSQNPGSPSPSGLQTANGSADSVTISGTKVGATVQITSYDDFDNPSNVAEYTLKDCVAPTTVLNYAYNTCGHLGQDYDSWEVNDHGGGGAGAGEGYDADYAEHICVEDFAGFQDEIGDGGENTVEGIPGQIGTPTLNITCRLLKDPASMPDVCAPINFFGLYDGTDIAQSNYYATSQSCNNGAPARQEERLYDATQWAAWGAFPDTIGVAFSENIKIADGVGIPDITWLGTTNITSLSIGNDISLTDDGDSPDGGPDADDSSTTNTPPLVDLVQITVDDVFTLANVDHGQIMGFSDVVEDAMGNDAERAAVIVNDLLPPFVEWAYWDGGITIQFNEPIAPVMTSDVVTICDPYFSNCTDISLDTPNMATLSEGDTRLTIPIQNVSAVGVDDSYFPTFDSTDTNTAAALTYNEPVYDGLGLGFTGPYDHAILDTSDIPDAHGNVGYANEGGNTWDQWQNGFADVDDNDQCNTPEFAVADVLGDFLIPTQNITNFDVADTAVCGGPYTHVMTYTFSHPLDDDVGRWPGVACNTDADPTTCSVAEINNATTGINTQAWVDANVDVDITGYSGSMLGTTVFSGVGASITSDRLSMTISFTNDCYSFQLGDIVDPDWVVFSTFGVGSGLNLNAFVVAQ